MIIAGDLYEQMDDNGVAESSFADAAALAPSFRSITPPRSRVRRRLGLMMPTMPTSWNTANRETNGNAAKKIGKTEFFNRVME